MKLEDNIAPIESGVRPRVRSETTSFGKPISLSASIRALKAGKGFRIDNFIWRRRVTATAHFLNIKVRTEKMDDGRLWVERL